MPLVRLLKADGSWQKLLNEWREQASRFGEDFDQYGATIFPLLDQLADEPDNKNAGIFGCPNPDREIETICQINRALLPGYEGPVLRVRHITVAPRLDFGDINVEDYASALIRLFFDVWHLSRHVMPAKNIKFHLKSPADRQFFAAVGNALGAERDRFPSVQIAGSWLYVIRV